MIDRVGRWLNYKYPQNYIIRNPVAGTLIIALFVFGFTSLYKPFNTHASRALSYETTMAFYSFLSGILLFLVIKLLKTFKSFSNSKDWTIYKEILSVFIILFVLGVAIYFLGFFIEQSAKRWNISTFLNSLKGAFLTGIIPLAYFTGINYRLLFWQNVNYNDENIEAAASENQPVENLIHIRSQLKNEELNFYPGQFLYAESDGNYVVFYLNRNNLIKKETIRNSINNIEQQLSEIPYFFRTHRAFILNLKKVRSKQGNTLGYQIKLSDTDSKIPVSRNNTKIFNKLLAQYHK
jgi:DNA-binding LytR/AlgR family response regulator